MESAQVTGKPRYNGTPNILEVTVERTVLKGGEFLRQATQAIVRIEGHFEPATERFTQPPNLGQETYLTPVVEVVVPDGNSPKTYMPRKGFVYVTAGAVVDYFNGIFHTQFVG